MSTRSRWSLDQWLTWLETAHTRKIDLGLERTRKVWRRLGEPLRETAKITVAGTNGKGSTVAMLCALAAASRQSFGCFTSPHLLRFNERIAMNGEFASDVEITNAFAAIDLARGEISLSYFEFATLAAFVLFARHDVDVALLEVGLGGRLDAVNILDADVAVITNIDLDHMHILGSTRAAIFPEKAGIARADRPLVVGESDLPSGARAHVAKSRAMALWRGEAFGFRDQGEGWEYWDTDQRMAALPYPALVGVHQLDNVSAALAAWAALRGEIDELAVRQALQSVVNPGRLQRVAEDPTFIVDVGHNAAASRSIAAYFARLPRRGRRAAVVGMLRDKDAQGFIDPMASWCDKVFAVPTDGGRGQEAERVAQACRSKAIACEIANGVVDGCTKAAAMVGLEGEVFVGGSFQIAAQALEHLPSWDADRTSGDPAMRQ